jgi:hypothetical protein
MTGSTFDRDRFEKTLAEVGSMLGELWAIEEVVRHVEANPEGEGFGGSGNGFYPRQSIGETHPFEYEAPEGSWSPLLTSGRNWGSEVVESARSLTWNIVRTESAPFDDAVESIRSGVVDPLGYNVADDFAGIDNNLAAWNGAAADAFGDWYGRVEIIARRQGYVAECVCAGIAASKAVVDLGQHSLQNVVDGIHSTLENQLSEAAKANGLPPDSSAFLALVLAASVLGALAAIPTGGASVAGTATAITALSTTAGVTSQLLTFAAANVPAGGGDERTASLRTSEEIFHELSGAIDEVMDNVRTQWQGVESKVSELLGNANAASDQHLLSPTRPRIVGRGATPDGFHHESAPR